jgi:hypothetical protein
MKYVVVTGGVVSGLGKGITSSSIGLLLKESGVRVTSIKIDPYLNTDAGTMSPYEHGEVYVLDDGGEVDLDLGNYERFLSIKLSRDHNITTGKVYQQVISRERKGDYLGKTVQVVPHVTDAIQVSEKGTEVFARARAPRIHLHRHRPCLVSGRASLFRSRSLFVVLLPLSTRTNTNTQTHANMHTHPYTHTQTTAARMHLFTHLFIHSF